MAMDVSHLLDDLNPAQREAVSTDSTHCLVLAGAGSGKTRVLTHRLAWLAIVGRTPAWNLLAVTFTNKAAAEMRARAEKLLGNQARGLTVGTFHGIAHRLLRQHAREAGLPEGFQILDGDDQVRLLKKTIQGMGLDESHFPARQAAWFINQAKDEGKRADAVNPGYHPSTRTWIDIYRTYETVCRRSGLVDFAELLLRLHETFLGNEPLRRHYQERFRHLLIDEFQDTNTIQYAWIRILAGSNGSVFAVGDDDQAIYGWRGAKVENVQQFLRDFPSAATYKLEQNYRSSASILAAANAVIAHNPTRLGKALWTSQGQGEAIDLYAAFNAEEEARFVVDRIQQWRRSGQPASACAVLYRSNAQSRLFEEHLLAQDIPYRVYGGQRFFDRAEIKDAIAYLRLIAHRHDDVAFERAINTPTRGIGERTLATVRERARGDGVSLWSSTERLLVDGTLGARAQTALRGFLGMIDQLPSETASLPLSACFAHVIERSQLRAHYAKDQKDVAESRLENLDELINAASRFTLTPEDEAAGLTELTAFLAHAALEAGEAEGEAWEDCVQLMTLHSAKGLEFQQVFLVGLEDGLFPSQKSTEDPSRLEEERRLAYVGITRARQKLVLSYAESRRLHGHETYNRPSRFLNELPQEVLQEVRPRAQLVRPLSHGLSRASNSYPQPAFGLGSRVSHAKFGEGVVLGYEGAGAHTIVLVNFSSAGPKRLVLAYANLCSL